MIGRVYPVRRLSRMLSFREFNPCHNASDGRFCSGTSEAPRTAGGRGATVPAAPARPDANPGVQDEASQYTRSVGLPSVTHGYVEVDQRRAMDIADAYDALPADASGDPAVRTAYEALGQEVQAQWDYATANGMRFEPWTREGQPYQTSAEMAADVRANRHLYFYTGGEPHPFLGAKDAQGLSLNDKFRAIHDYYGHAAGGYGFGPRGEENAWVAHSQMFTPSARPAMTTETRGQNSWVNFGRHNYDAQGNYRNVPPAQRPFATQKVALLPRQFWGRS